MPYIYILLFLLLLLASAFDYCLDGLKILPFIIVIVLSFFLAFRFGQGADYFSYYSIFQTAGKHNGSIIELTRITHSEIGFLLLSSFFYKAGITFEIFVFFVSLFEVLCLYRFVRSYCPKQIIAWLLAFPTLYLTYYFSALREGMVIAGFLGILIPLLFKRKYVLYYCLCLVFISIHSVSLFLVIVPLWINIEKKIKDLIVSVAISFAVGIMIGFTPAKEILRYSTSNPSIPAILIRLIEFAFIILFSSDIYGTKTTEGIVITFMVDCFVLGLLFYGLFFSTDLMSSRVMAVFSFVDISIFSIILKSKTRKSLLVLMFIVFFVTILFYKNINAYISWNSYKNTTFWNYPYVSVFNKERILDYYHVDDSQRYGLSGRNNKETDVSIKIKDKD